MAADRSKQNDRCELNRWSFAFALMVLIGCAAPGRALDPRVKAYTPAGRLYIAKCAKCHQFYDPARYSDGEWHDWMVKMNKKAKLNPEEADLLSRYIETTLRHPPEAGAGLKTK